LQYKEEKDDKEVTNFSSTMQDMFGISGFFNKAVFGNRFHIFTSCWNNIFFNNDNHIKSLNLKLCSNFLKEFQSLNVFPADENLCLLNNFIFLSLL
jgi:hypothetical protein